MGKCVKKSRVVGKRIIAGCDLSNDNEAILEG